MLEKAVAGGAAEAALGEALRESVLALEFHLDAVRAWDGMEVRVRGEEPRLLGEISKLDGQLSGLLTELWEFQRALTSLGPAEHARLAEVCAEMRKASEHETDLLFELHAPLGGPE